MAVVDVWAEVNGQTCKASCSGGDVWSLIAPSDCPDGCYTCGFWAKDGAGNIAYTTAMLWVFDGKFTCIKWVEDKYRIKLLNQEYIATIKEDMYRCHYVRRGCKA